jgi:hypothetical protein
MDVSVNESVRLEPQSSNGTRRHRTGKKRLKFAPPQIFPRGVRELWTAASREEQETAHHCCTQILAMWLGKRRREEVSLELSIPPLRVWQLSQQALAGMLAGLLHQPRPRRRQEETTMDPIKNDLRAQAKRIAELERLLADREDLIRLLSSLPKPRTEPSESVRPTPAAKTRTRRRGAGAEAPPADVLRDTQAGAR